MDKEHGIGGNFRDAEHTLRHFRREQWQPGIFARETLNTWRQQDRKLATDKARDQAKAILDDYHPRGMDEGTEDALRAVIERAEHDLLG